MSNALPNSIATYLRRAVLRTRIREMLAATFWAAAVFGAWGLSACAIDRIAHLSAEARVGLLAGGAAAGIAVLLWRLRKWHRRIDWVAVAAVVEAHRLAFGQRLVTVASRLLGPGEHRGSEAMLAQLRAEVEALIAKDDSPAVYFPRRAMVWPMLACAAAIAVSAGMLRLPGLRLPQLAERYALPWRATPAVTTTQLFVQPDRDSDLTDSTELRVDVSADRLGDGAVSLFAQLADQKAAPWSRLTMDQLSPGRFEYVFSGIDRDLRYYVAGGDAVSRVYLVRVLRKPAVAAFRIGYRYPAYVRQAEAIVTNTDGRIEAPAGTAAEITIVATEPLQSATLRLDGQSIAMAEGVDAATFSATIPIGRDQYATLELLSTRHMSASTRLRIRAIPIRPPVLRLTDASGEPGALLSVNPRQVLPVAFEAEDDYGLLGLSLRWRINGSKSGESAVAIPDGVRHIEDAVDFDLASLPLRVGDVLTVWLEVHNTAGQKATSQPIEALMATQPVDAEMRQRLAALDAAAGFADRLSEHLSAALPKEASTRPNPAAAPRRGAEGETESLSAALSSATEDAGLLRQSLLRAIAHGAPAQSATALAEWVDDATVQSYWADRLFQQLGDSGALDAAATSRLAELARSAQFLRDKLQVVDQGGWAQASLAEREDVKSSSRQSGVAMRIRQNAADDAKAAGCGEGPNLSAQLATKVAQADLVMAAMGPVHFVPPAQRWASEVAENPHVRPSLAQRLRSAAEAEALRQHGDLSAARDLELSSRAAEALEMMAADHRIDADLKGYVAALSALQWERLMNVGAPTPLVTQQAIRQAAESARKQMDQWARLMDGVPDRVASGSHGAAPAASPRAAARSAESVALAAAAGTAVHHAPTARPAAPLVAGPSIAAAHMRSDATMSHTLATAQQLDAIGQKQQDLLQQTSAAQPAEAPVLAQRQQQVADSIATVAAGSEPAAIAGGDDNPANWRQRESAALQAIGQQLAEMPQQLATAQDALHDATAAAAHAQSARAELARLNGGPRNAGSADLIAAAERAAQQSSADADDAARRLNQSVQPVSVAMARDMAQQLGPFAPEASAAVSAIGDHLAPALADFERSIHARDASATDRAAGAARDAIAAAQQALADAQDALTARDPLVTASSSARAAVASLRRTPPDFSTAVRHQTQVTLALSRAWDQSIHGAAAQRLAAVPGLQPLFASGASATTAMAGSSDGAVPLAAQIAPPPGEAWGRPPGQLGAGGGSGDSADPPGFEDALRLYFQALGQAQKEGK